MNNELNKNKVEQLKVLTDYSLWTFLAQRIKKDNKFSRFEALYDLIQRQYLVCLKDGDGYLEGTITDFTKKWKWDRETVNKFLDQLQQIGILSVVTTKNRPHFRINYIKDVSEQQGAANGLSQPVFPSQATNSP